MDIRFTIRIFVLCTVLIVIQLAIYDFWKHFEVNRCAMSYMTLEPNYKPISLTNSYPNLNGYRLFQYCNGLCRPVKSRAGFPVLFIPGNRGSFKTVRSMASAQEYYYSDIAHFPFDFFVLDFGEELSSLSGEVIVRHSSFLRISIERILSLYENTVDAPKSVFLVGHSMGTLTILNLLADPSFDGRSVTTVLSLSGPIRRPVFSPGPKMDQIYERIDKYLLRLSMDPSHNLVLISITGGTRDLLVPDVLGFPFPRPRNSLWLPTSSILHVWASCDHLCILWCRQLIHQIHLSLEEFRKQSSSLNYSNPEMRLRWFRSRFVTPSLQFDLTSSATPAESQPTIPATVVAHSNPRWMYFTDENHLAIEHSLPESGAFVKLGPFFQSATQPQHVLIMLRQFSRHISMPVETRDRWLYFCRAKLSTSNGTEKHQPCESLHKEYHQVVTKFTFLPSADPVHPHKVVLLSSNQLLHSFFVVLHLNPIHGIDSRFSLVVDTFNSPTDRVSVFPRLSILRGFLGHSRVVQFHRTAGATNSLLPVFYRLQLKSSQFALSPTIPVPRLVISARNCSRTPRIHSPDLAGVLTWHLESNDYHYASRLNADSVHVIDLDVPDWSFKDNVDSTAFVDFFFNPFCTYDVSVHYSVFAWIGKLLRLHWPHLSGMFCLHLLIRIAHTLHSASFRDAGSLQRGNSNRFTKPDRITKRYSTWHVGINWHLLAGTIQCLSFHLLDISFSHWLIVHKSGHAGTRLVNSLTHHVGSFSLDSLIPLFVFPILALLASFLMPCLLDLLVVVIQLVSALLVRLLARVPVHNASSTSFSAKHIAILCISLSGMFVSEAFCVLSLGLLVLFNLFLAELEVYRARRNQNDKLSLRGEPLTPIPLMFRLHRLVFLCLIALSLLLLENWMSLLFRVQVFLRSGTSPWQLPNDPVIVLLLGVMTNYLLSPSFSPIESTRCVRRRPSLFFRWLSSSGAGMCMFVLMHLALKAYPIFLACSVGLSLMLAAADTSYLFPV